MTIFLRAPDKKADIVGKQKVFLSKRHIQTTKIDSVVDNVQREKSMWERSKENPMTIMVAMKNRSLHGHNRHLPSKRLSPLQPVTDRRSAFKVSPTHTHFWRGIKKYCYFTTHTSTIFNLQTHSLLPSGLKNSVSRGNRSPCQKQTVRGKLFFPRPG